MVENMKSIRVACSSMAKLTGHNTFTDKEKVVKQLLQYNKFSKRDNYESKLEEVVSTFDKVKLNMIKRYMDLSENSTSKVIYMILLERYVNPSLNIDLSEEKAKILFEDKIEGTLIKEELENVLYEHMIMERGKLKEKSNLDKLEKDKNCVIIDRNTCVYSKIIYTDPNGEFKLELRGKVDGKLKDGTVVESKNRSRRLFGEIPDYEKVQMECYMNLLECDKGLLVEHYNNYCNEIEYDHNEDFWNECLEKASNFVRSEVVPLL